MEESDSIKLFTPDEANQLLPRLSALIQTLQNKREVILSREVEIDALEMVVEKNAEGESSLLNQKVAEYQLEVRSFYDLVDEIQGLGCLLKDVSLGLVDFYSEYQGRMVYLCWKLGDPEVGHWHEIGSGYAFRQPILKEHS